MISIISISSGYLTWVSSALGAKFEAVLSAEHVAQLIPELLVKAGNCRTRSEQGASVGALENN